MHDSDGQPANLSEMLWGTSGEQLLMRSQKRSPTSGVERTTERTPVAGVTHAIRSGVHRGEVAHKGGPMFGREKSRRKEMRRLVANEDYDEIARVLASNSELARELINLLEEQSGDIGENAAHAIGLLGQNEDRAPGPVLDIAPQLVELLGHHSRLTRFNAVMLVYELACHLEWDDCEERVRPFARRVVELLQDQDAEVREWATNTIQAIAEVIEDRSGDFGDLQNAVQVLQKLLRDEAAAPAAVAALRAIAHRRPAWVQSAIPDLLEAFPHEKDFANVMAAGMLAYLAEYDSEHTMAAEPLLRALLSDPWERIQEQAALAMGFLGAETEDGTVQRILTGLLEDNREVVREAAARALSRKTGESGRVGQGLG